MEPISVLDMHTGGEPVRIITGGCPPVEGASILEKRAYMRERLDHVRRLVVFEPRGHFDMYGVVPVTPSLPGADMAVLFMHNEGYSTMCGHAVIALGRYAVDHGIVAAREPVTRVGIECPCGLVEAEVAVTDGRAGAVAFESVPAFLAARDVSVEVAGHGRVLADIAYGGAFYALADAARFGLDFDRDGVRAFTDAAAALTEAVRAAHAIRHPDHADLGYLYGSILTDGGDGRLAPSRNVCVFADRQVDRSPTGSGVTARMAALHARGQAPAGEERLFESITGSRFTGSVARKTTAGEHEAVTVRVAGMAHYCGRAEFSLEDGDAIGSGFLLR
jgi:proline racemase